MNHQLAEVLVTKGFLRAECEIDAVYLANGLSAQAHKVQGTFFIKTVSKQDDRLIFEAASVKDGSTRRLTAESITAIDGMEPERFAAVYNIRPNGDKAKLGKRRGRKPKVARVEEDE